MGLYAGAIAGSATAGVLLGFGIRRGMPMRSFNEWAAVLLGRTAAGLWEFHPLVSSVGVVLHFAWIVGWSVIFALVAGHLAGMRLAGAAVLLAVLLLVMRLGMSGFGVGQGSGFLSSLDLLVLHAVFAGALGAGMRLAQMASRG